MIGAEYATIAWTLLKPWLWRAPRTRIVAAIAALQRMLRGTPSLYVGNVTMNEIEFAGLAGFFPAQEHMDRVNCACAGQGLHQGCGCCSCGVPRSAVCACRWPAHVQSIQHRADCHNAQKWAQRIQDQRQAWSVPADSLDLDRLHAQYMQGASAEEAFLEQLEELTSRT